MKNDTYQELHSQVFLFNRFMGELLAAAAPLLYRPWVGEGAW